MKIVTWWGRLEICLGFSWWRGAKTCKECGAHLRISFWHLLMNWAYKKQNNFNIYNVAFKKVNKEKHLDTSLSKSWWYNLQFLRYRAKQIKIFFIFCHFTPLKTKNKSKFCKNEKKMPGDINHFTNAYHNCQSHEVWFLRYGVQKIEFFVILDHFLPFYFHNNPKNQNFEKMKKHLETSSFYTFVP